MLPSIPLLVCRIPVWETNEENLKALALCPAPVEAIGIVTLISEGEGQSLPVQNVKSLHLLPVLPPVCLSPQEFGDNYRKEDRDHWWPPHKKMMGKETRGNSPAGNSSCQTLGGRPQGTQSHPGLGPGTETTRTLICLLFWQSQIQKWGGLGFLKVHRKVWCQFQIPLGLESGWPSCN